MIGITGCGSGNSGSSKQEDEQFTAIVDATEVRSVSQSEQTRLFTGVVKGRRESRLGFNQPGRIETMVATEGDQVRSGQILARLNTDSLLAKKKQTLADKKAAEALLSELIAGPRNQEILSAKATVTQLDSDFQLAEIRRKRHHELRNSGAISGQEFDNSYYLSLAAKGRLEAARQNLSLLQEGTRKEKIAAQKARIAQLAAAIESIDVSLKESQILAPYEGIIADRLSDEGEIVSPGVAIFSIVETNHLQAWVGVPEKNLKSLKIGATYNLNGEQGAVQGRLKSILPKLNSSTRTRTVILDLLPSSTSQLASGSVVRLELKELTKQEGFWLPTSALTRGEKGLWSAMGLQPETSNSSLYRTKRLDLEVLHIESDRVLVRGTLVDGQKIIRSGLHKLTVNQLVTLRGEE